MDEYANEVSAFLNSWSIGKPIDEEFHGVIMLQGLLDKYDVMVMAKKTLVSKDFDFVQIKLLQDKK